MADIFQTVRFDAACTKNRKRLKNNIEAVSAGCDLTCRVVLRKLSRVCPH